MQHDFLKKTSTMAACKQNPIVRLERIKISTDLSSVSAVNLKKEYIPDLVPRVKIEIDAPSEKSEVDNCFSSFSLCQRSKNAVTEGTAVEQAATFPSYSVMNDQKCSFKIEPKVSVKTETGQKANKFVNSCPESSSQQCDVRICEPSLAAMKREPKLEDSMSMEGDSIISPPSVVNGESLKESKKLSLPSSVYYDRNSIKLKDVRVILVDLFPNLKKHLKMRTSRKSLIQVKLQSDSENSNLSGSRLRKNSDKWVKARLAERRKCQVANESKPSLQSLVNTCSSLSKCNSKSGVPASFSTIENTSENEAKINLSNNEGCSEISKESIKSLKDYSESWKVEEHASENGVGAKSNMNKYSVENETEISSDTIDSSFKKRARLRFEINKSSSEYRSGISLNVNECKVEQLGTASLNVDEGSFEKRARISSKMDSSFENGVWNSSSSECRPERFSTFNMNLNDSTEEQARKDQVRFSSKGNHSMSECLDTFSLNLNEPSLGNIASSKMKEVSSENPAGISSNSSEYTSERFRTFNKNVNKCGSEKRARKDQVRNCSNGNQFFSGCFGISPNLIEHSFGNITGGSSKTKESSLENQISNSSNNSECTSEHLRTFCPIMNEHNLENRIYSLMEDSSLKDQVENSLNVNECVMECVGTASLNLDEGSSEKRARVSSKMKDSSFENRLGNNSNSNEHTLEYLRRFSPSINEHRSGSSARISSKTKDSSSENPVGNSSNSRERTPEGQKMTNLNTGEQLKKRASVSPSMKELSSKNQETFLTKDKNNFENQSRTSLNTICSLESRAETTSDRGLRPGHSGEGNNECEQFFCAACKEPFYDVDTLKSHTDSCGGFWHTCTQCPLRTRSTDELSLHMLQVHTDMTPCHCTMCPARFQSYDLLRSHFKTHNSGKPFSCPLCQRRFSCLEHVRHHVIDHKPLAHACLLCPKKFVSRHRMTQHFVSAHSNKKPKEFRCKLCPATFKTTQDLNGHLLSHITGKTLKCPECPQEFQSKKSLLVHLTEHLGQERASTRTFDMQQLINVAVDSGFENQAAVGSSKSDSFKNQGGNRSESFSEANESRMETRGEAGWSLKLVECGTENDGENGSNSVDGSLEDRVVNADTSNSSSENCAEVRPSMKELSPKIRVKTSFEANESSVKSQAEISSSVGGHSSESREKTTWHLNDQVETICISDDDGFEDEQETSLNLKESSSENQPEMILLQDGGSSKEGRRNSLNLKEASKCCSIETISTGTFEDGGTSLNMKKSNSENGPEVIWLSDEDTFEETSSTLQDSSLESRADIISEGGSRPEGSVTTSMSRRVSSASFKNYLYPEHSRLNSEAQQSRSNLESLLAPSGNSSGVKPSCMYCPKLFFSWAEANEHVKKHACKRTFLHPSASNCHSNTNCDKSLQVCACCSETFASKDSPAEHRMYVHSNESSLSGLCGSRTANNESYPCISCSRTFSQVEDLRKHSEGCGTRRFVCALCSKSYKAKRTLAPHLRRVHSIENHFRCACCSATFATALGLRVHEKVHSKKPIVFALSADKFTTVQDQYGYYLSVFENALKSQKDAGETGRVRKIADKLPLSSQTSVSASVQNSARGSGVTKELSAENHSRKPSSVNNCGLQIQVVDSWSMNKCPFKNVGRVSPDSESSGIQGVTRSSTKGDNQQDTVIESGDSLGSADVVGITNEGSLGVDEFCSGNQVMASSYMNSCTFEKLDKTVSSLHNHVSIISKCDSQEKSNLSNESSLEDVIMIDSALNEDICGSRIGNSSNTKERYSQEETCLSVNRSSVQDVTMISSPLSESFENHAMVGPNGNEFSSKTEASNISKMTESLKNLGEISSNLYNGSLENSTRISPIASECETEAFILSAINSDQPFLCRFCPLRFKKSQNLHLHLKTHLNENESQLICPLCAKTFKAEHKLSRHITETHSKYPFSCNYCPAIFKTVEDMHWHRRKHDDGSFVSCTLCTRVFSDAPHLKCHMQSHSDKRPYSCWVCSKTFKRYSSKQNHVKMKHSDKRLLF